MEQQLTFDLCQEDEEMPQAKTDPPKPDDRRPLVPPKKLPAFYFHDDECHCENCRVTW